MYLSSMHLEQLGLKLRHASIKKNKMLTCKAILYTIKNIQTAAERDCHQQCGEDPKVQKKIAGSCSFAIITIFLHV